MKTSRLQTLWERVDDFHQHYALHFAGQPRLTRDIDIIDSLIDGLERTIRETQGRGDPATLELQELLDIANEHLEMYREERAAIAKVQKEEGPKACEVAGLMTRVQAVLHRYTRHFAGHERHSRDLGLLGEMIDDMTLLGQELDTLRGGPKVEFAQEERDLVDQYIELFSRERREIGQARDTGSLSEQGYILGAAVNELLATFQSQVVGLSRFVCRPELLMRLIAELEDLRERLVSLETLGLHAEFHRENISNVDENIAVWREELHKVKNVRASVKHDDFVEAFLAVADQLLEEYNISFAEVEQGHLDLTKLSDLCDRMDEVERQLTVLLKPVLNRDNKRNLQLIRDAQFMLMNEYDTLSKAPNAQRKKG